jgi:hypothetical protein
VSGLITVKATAGVAQATVERVDSATSRRVTRFVILQLNAMVCRAFAGITVQATRSVTVHLRSLPSKTCVLHQPLVSTAQVGVQRSAGKGIGVLSDATSRRSAGIMHT